ncbi:MAG: hypothetical protein FWF73_02410 [Spirochaetes bacterium]|nr:hypothetical protein [Spirochaetota bacterium]
MSETKYWMVTKDGNTTNVFHITVDAWWGEEFMSGDCKKTKPPANDKDQKKEKNLESDYGKSVKIIVKTKGLAESLAALAKLGKSKDINVKIDIYRKSASWDLFKEDAKIGDATGIIPKTTNSEEITIPVFLDEKWCYEDRRWYKYKDDKHKEWYNYKETSFIGQNITSLKKDIEKLKDQLYFKISIGDREEYIPFAKDDGYFLTA